MIGNDWLIGLFILCVGFDALMIYTGNRTGVNLLFFDMGFLFGAFMDRIREVGLK